jgi:ring-1,2-phenylacetyl-CoA epoxidase subunit PaaD
MVTNMIPTQDEIRWLLQQVVDPDIPVVSIDEIGILRDITVSETGDVVVYITPTYSGCPALGVIEEDVVSVLEQAGIDKVRVEIRHFPVWTTEWLTSEAKHKLANYGIAPPDSVLAVVPEVLCPQCASESTTKVSEFGSTACKSLWVCTSCREPFDYFKAI